MHYVCTQLVQTEKLYEVKINSKQKKSRIYVSIDVNKTNVGYHKFILRNAKFIDQMTAENVELQTGGKLWIHGTNTTRANKSGNNPAVYIRLNDIHKIHLSDI